MDQRHKWMVTARFEKRALLIAVNCLAGTSIFFFGYDQGMMGGVNNARHYIDLMRFGYVDDDGVLVVTNTLLQGGGPYWISGKPGSGKSTLMSFMMTDKRTRTALGNWNSQPKFKS